MDLRSHSKRIAESQHGNGDGVAPPAKMLTRGKAFKPAPGARAACHRCNDKYLACSSLHDHNAVCTQCLANNFGCIHRFSRMGQQPHQRDGVKSFHVTLQKNGLVEGAARSFWSHLFGNNFNSEFGLSVSADSVYGNPMEMNVCADKMLRNEFSFNVPDTTDVNGLGTVCRFRYGDGSGSSTIGITPA